MRRAATDKQTKNYLASNLSNSVERLTLKDKRAIDKAINRLGNSEQPKLQIELSSETMKRLLREKQISLSEIRCLNKSSKDGVCRCLLRSCYCI